MKFDALVITALDEELDAVLSLTEVDGSLAFADPKKAKWVKTKDSTGFPYYYREFTTESNGALSVGAAWTGAMGETATADRCRALVADLNPLCVAMTGICAGRKGEVFLGDVILADKLFSYDHGKLIATTNADGSPGRRLLRELETYNLQNIWAMEAAGFVKDLNWLNKLLGSRPLSLDVQRGWVLQTLLLHETENGAKPWEHPDFKVRCPRWQVVVDRLQRDKLVRVKNGVMTFTSKGKNFALNQHLRFPDGPEPDPTFRVHIGPIGTGKTVVQDPNIFAELETVQRKILGLEMEAAAIGYVAENVGIPSIVAKAVSDYADLEKDNAFRVYAEKASSAFLIEFLKKYPPGSLRRKGELKPDRLPVLVSSDHVAELHEIALKWATNFKSLLKPAWSANALSNLEKINSDEGLLALRQHFPEVRREYADWYSLNDALSGIWTMPWEVMGQWGDKPMDSEGESLVREHNDAVRDLVAELAGIQSQTSISGECDLCKEGSRSKKSGPMKKPTAAKKPDRSIDSGPAAKLASVKKRPRG